MSDPDDVDQRLRALAGALDEMESSVARSPAGLMTSIVKRVSKRRLLSAAMSVGVIVALVPIALMTVGVLTSSLRDSSPSVRPSLEGSPSEKRSPGIAMTEIDIDSFPTSLLYFEGQLWFDGGPGADGSSHTLAHVPADVSWEIAPPSSFPDTPVVLQHGAVELVAWDGFIYVAGGGDGGDPHGAVARIDPHLGEVVDPDVFDGQVTTPRGLAVGEGSLWIGDASGGGVFRLNNDGAVTEMPEMPSPVDIAVGFGYAWVVDSEDGDLYRIDTETEQSSAVGDGCVSGVTVGGDWIWSSSSCDDSVLRRDPATNEVEEIDVGGSVGDVAFSEDGLWVIAAHGAGQRLLSMDPVSNEIVDQVGIGSEAVGLAEGGGFVFFIDTETWRIIRASIDS